MSFDFKVNYVLTKYIIELHDGTIDVYSEGKDHGARFTISLPIES